MKRMLSFLIAFLLSSFSGSGSPPENPITLRALMISSDHYVTQQTTYPAGKNNLSNLQAILSKDIRSYAAIHTHYEQIADSTAFQTAVSSAFTPADDNDISFLYISAHGSYADGKAGLYLSNGTQEYLLTTAALADAVRAIPGEKILVLDACNSGAFIEKGLNSLSLSNPFADTNCMVITSAGGAESSWNWNSGAHTDANTGGSYFTDALIAGLSSRAADTNRDGAITISELFSFLTVHYAASTPQCYPMNTASFPFYQYNPGSTASIINAISDITFEETLLVAGESNIAFSFTVHRPSLLYYQLVYHKQGQWDFENAQWFQDVQEGEGPLTPGRKQRSLHLNTANDASGYIMLQLFTLENELPAYQGSRLLCVQPDSGDISLFVRTAAFFYPQVHRELPILVQHDHPCGLSVTVKNISGKTVRRLSYAQPTRPQQLVPSASTFSWDGTDQQGNPVETGLYYIHVQTTIAGTRYTCESDYFQLYASEKSELP